MKDKVVEWTEVKPKYNIAIIHPQGHVHFCIYDPDNADNACGNYPYLDNGGCRPDMRYWQVHTVYPMTCYEDRHKLGMSVQHKRPLYTCMGQAYIVDYDRKLDVFNAIKISDNTPVVLTKKQIKFM